MYIYERTNQYKPHYLIYIFVFEQQLNILHLFIIIHIPSMYRSLISYGIYNICILIYLYITHTILKYMTEMHVSITV